MPKRSNPYADTFSPQFKTHIGIKEVNMGVNWKHNMKPIYNKTQELLFNGTKKQFSQLNSTINGKLPSKQNNWSFLMVKEHSDVKTNLAVHNQPCTSQSYCSFCDRLLISPNSNICELCKGEFCHMCSILRYEKHEETAICLTCLQN